MKLIVDVQPVAFVNIMGLPGALLFNTQANLAETPFSLPLPKFGFS